MECKAYFHSCRIEGHPEQPLCVRVGNALSRAGVRTMAQLCRMSEDELRRIRNLGNKGLAIVMAERQKYQKGLNEGNPR